MLLNFLTLLYYFSIKFSFSFSKLVMPKKKKKLTLLIYSTSSRGWPTFWRVNGPFTTINQIVLLSYFTHSPIMILLLLEDFKSLNVRNYYSNPNKNTQTGVFRPPPSFSIPSMNTPFTSKIQCKIEKFLKILTVL